VSKEAWGTFKFSNPTPEQLEQIRRGELPSHTMAPRLPRRIWPGTSQAIKYYLAHPVDYDNLNEHEIPTDAEIAMFSKDFSKEQMAFVTNAVALEAAEERAAHSAPVATINPQSLIAKAQAKPPAPEVGEAIAKAKELAESGLDAGAVRSKLRELGYAVPIVARAVREIADESVF